ncbi:hypothetical protein [Methylopila turkensis]|uniref:Uncharacterized protein n=1 Tax=Methylopila turkensis TaxID=1437816 RepID=A0A9W6JPL9_9HYPH|nr:hypothetical protein [Methylopila turkensis]GLK81435.1 hypothetical protein GCM10008174_31760 [Methylopila turkensis]
MHRFRSRRFFYISLLGWTAAFGLVFDYLVATVPGAGEPWFYSFGIMIYSLALFVMTVLHFDQSGQL